MTAGNGRYEFALRNWIILTDSHLGKAQNDFEPFRAFLNSCDWSAHHLILLGDIYDMWGVSRQLADDTQLKLFDFLDKIRREYGTYVVFCQGNRDLLVPPPESRAARNLPFDRIIPEEGYVKLNNGREIFLCHGDLLNQKAHGHIRYRRFMSGRVMRMTGRLLPAGVIRAGISRLNRLLSGKTPSGKNKPLPMDYFKAKLKEVSSDCSKRKMPPVIALFGHFHPDETLSFRENNAEAYVLKPWFKGNTYYTLRMNGELAGHTYIGKNL